MDLGSIGINILWSVVVSIGFACLFSTPRRALWVAGLLGAVGFGTKSILLASIMPAQPIFTSLFGAAMIGFLGMYFAHRVHTPPIVFTIPAVINMVPGQLGYRFMMDVIEIMSQGNNVVTDGYMIREVLHNGLQCFFITLALALGIAFPVIIFNSVTVKNKDPHLLIRKGLEKIKNNQ